MEKTEGASQRKFDNGAAFRLPAPFNQIMSTMYGVLVELLKDEGYSHVRVIIRPFDEDEMTDHDCGAGNFCVVVTKETPLPLEELTA